MNKLINVKISLRNTILPLFIGIILGIVPLVAGSIYTFQNFVYILLIPFITFGMVCFVLSLINIWQYISVQVLGKDILFHVKDIKNEKNMNIICVTDDDLKEEYHIRLGDNESYTIGEQIHLVIYRNKVLLNKVKNNTKPD